MSTVPSLPARHAPRGPTSHQKLSGRPNIYTHPVLSHCNETLRDSFSAWARTGRSFASPQPFVRDCWPTPALVQCWQLSPSTGDESLNWEAAMIDSDDVNAGFNRARRNQRGKACTPRASQPLLCMAQWCDSLWIPSLSIVTRCHFEKRPLVSGWHWGLFKGVIFYISFFSFHLKCTSDVR